MRHPRCAGISETWVPDYLYEIIVVENSRQDIAYFTFVFALFFFLQ